MGGVLALVKNPAEKTLPLRVPRRMLLCLRQGRRLFHTKKPKVSHSVEFSLDGIPEHKISLFPVLLLLKWPVGCDNKVRVDFLSEPSVECEGQFHHGFSSVPRRLGDI